MVNLHLLPTAHKPLLSVINNSSSPLSSGTVSGGGGEEILPNAIRRQRYPGWRSSGASFSLGVDLGGSRTGLALGKGFSSPRPLVVLKLRGEKLELELLKVAEKHEVDEFIVGLPKSIDGKETPQSNKVRSIAGRLAVRAAERCWRVFLQDEHGTSKDALQYMIDAGLRRSARKGKIDAYSAMMVLDRYFSTSGHGAELVLPREKSCKRNFRIVCMRIQPSLQERASFVTTAACQNRTVCSLGTHGMEK